MYPRILVPLDGSDLAQQVLPYVRTLGKGLRARIDLLQVVEPTPPWMAGATFSMYLHRIAEEMIKGAQAHLKAVEESLQGSGLSVSCTVQEGRAASNILGEAEKEPGTLVAMSTHGRSGIGRWIMGSVTDRVLHASAFPMLVVRPQAYGGSKEEVKLKSIIVPLDGSPLAEQVLPHVVALARGLALNVTLVKATPAAAEYRRYMECQPLGGGATIYYGPYEEFSQKADAEAMEYLHQVRQRLRHQGAPSVEERLLHGHAAAGIVDLARETPDNLVAMTTHGRSGVGRWLLGSVTNRVVGHSGSPVLVVRATEKAKGPEGETP